MTEGMRGGVHTKTRLVATATLASAALAIATAASDAAPDPSGHSPRPVQTSDGTTGRLATPLPRARLARTSSTDVERYWVAPGLRYRHLLRTDARGTVEAYLLRADLDKPGLSLQYAGAQHVDERAPLTRLLKADGAVAGVNADFFDIDDTGAPLGVGVDDGDVLHGPRAGWTAAFSVTATGTAQIGKIPVRARVVGRPGIRITGVNSPHIPINGLGLYTPRWKCAPGYAVVDGALHRNVRQVHVRHGRVVGNTRRLTSGHPVEGRLLVGRGAGAKALAARLPVGSRVRFAVTAAGEPQLAVGGSGVLVAGGKVVASDDGELHPRTAVGVDRSGKVLLVVVDGRSESSSGYTLAELAQLMVDLRADQALNLDGGGSSTIAVTRPRGALAVANAPSDGEQRRVPEGLELLWSPPASWRRG